ncbi:MAG TPA: sialidase family protein, partial [Planctomycetaceae bacterium]|nr:sialidase family protein [Planctomycetaceae bacterium]
MPLSFPELAIRRVLIAVAGLVLAIACGNSGHAAPRKAGKPANKAPASRSKAATDVRLVRVPQGGLQPQVAVDSEGTVHLVYLADDPQSANVFYVQKARSEDANIEAFSKPLHVNSQPGSAIAIGSIRGAQLALGKANRVHVAWNGSGKAEPKGQVKYGNPMLYSRLADDGAGFEPQRNVIHEAYGLDGGGSVAADRQGNVYVTWHAGSNEASRRVWVARSDDDGATFKSEIEADSGEDGACGCCGMKAMADDRGTLFMLYRSAREKVNRDMLLLTSNDRGKTFRRELAGNWIVDVCPMSSEAFVETPESVLAAWETDGQAFFSRIDKKDRQLSKPIAAPGSADGRKHPALAANSRGETILVWTEGTG